MRGFHVDMNVAQYRGDYLEKWLEEFARRGYDTIVWEVENNVQWETCPECVSPDAFSKREFREMLDLSRHLGLEPIPLFQTIAHCEYVLKHERYQHLAEIPGKIDQYCPRNTDLLPFLAEWIEEYLGVFGSVDCFHLGADEAWWMGKCERCKTYVAEHSLSELFIEHVNALSRPLIERGIRPAIWADMVLHHNEALDLLSRDVVLFDWQYAIHRGAGRVHVWGTGSRYADNVPPEAMERFGRHLFPDGDEPGRDPETFYTADFLAEQGFEVVTCPSASSWGDTVFMPRNWFHLANTFDSFAKGMSPHLHGSVLTSWSVRLHPWELQLACIDVPHYLEQDPEGDLHDFQQSFVAERFGLEDGGSFFSACGLLAKRCLFTDSGTLHVLKSCPPADSGLVVRTLDRLAEKGETEREHENCLGRLDEYRRGLLLFEGLAAQASYGSEYLDVWQLAARNLVNRAEVSAFLLEHHEQVRAGEPAPDADREKGAELLATLRELKDETRRFYEATQRPTRAEQTVAWIFGPVEAALSALVEA